MRKVAVSAKPVLREASLISQVRPHAHAVHQALGKAIGINVKAARGGATVTRQALRRAGRALQAGTLTKMAGQSAHNVLLEATALLQTTSNALFALLAVLKEVQVRLHAPAHANLAPSVLLGLPCATHARQETLARQDRVTVRLAREGVSRLEIRAPNVSCASLGQSPQAKA